MEFLCCISIALVISLLFVSIIGIYKDRNLDLQIKIENLQYDNNKLIKENNDLKKYKTLYELDNNRRIKRVKK